MKDNLDLENKDNKSCNKNGILEYWNTGILE